MGAFLDKPKTEKSTSKGQGNGTKFAVAAMQGWRIEMEDAHSARAQLPAPFESWSFFGVFDGHAGSKISEYASEHLWDHILNTQGFKTLKDSAAKTGKLSVTKEQEKESVKAAAKEGFLVLDAHMRTLPEVESGEDKSGSTAVALLISPDFLYLMNCGDSRALIARNSEVLETTLDHKPTNPEERDRIEKAGGSVMIQRVNGSLAVSRALGDYEYKNQPTMDPKEQLVSPEPDVTVVPRDPSDEFVVLACDGVWDVMTNPELCQFIRSRLGLTDDLEEVCKQIVDTCLYKGSRDNMSVVLVAFDSAPKVSSEAKQKEKQLEDKLENKIKEIVAQAQGSEDIDLPMLLHNLNLCMDEFDGILPPGGGLSAKRSFIEKIFYQMRPEAAKPDQETAGGKDVSQ